MSTNKTTSIPSVGTEHWTNVINAVRGPWSWFALVILVIYGALIPVVFYAQLDPWAQNTIGVGLTVLLFFIVGIVALIVWSRPGNLAQSSGSKTEVPDVEMDPATTGDTELEPIVKSQGADVLYAQDKQRPTLGFWFREMRPYLHQAAHYSVPTYYLDTKLNVVDWNIAFEVVFEDLVGHIRGKHVNWFIARLANHDEVFTHARNFTKDVREKGAFPFVDKEPIDYQSPEYGMVRTLKVATQLSDTRGVGRGWAVALIPREINWGLFEENLFTRIHADKRWSIYSASYDRVLLKFPPYHTLIEDVVSVVPDGNLAVADLGCGTGNASKALVQHGHRVTAIENNLGMLDRFASKSFDPEVTKLIKSSVEHLEFVPSESFDAAVMVNVLYALDHPLECLRSIHRILRPDGVLGLSTTHRDTDLSPLLASIEKQLEDTGELGRLVTDWNTVERVNRSLEKTIVRRHTRDEIREMVILAGFDITRDLPSTYEGAVMLIHARKHEETLSTSTTGQPVSADA